MSIFVKMLGPADAAVLARVAPEVFDDDVDSTLAAEFLGDPRHHIAVAIDDDVVVGFVSAVHYVHPDKPPELWINEVGVAPSHHRRGIAKRLLQVMFAHAESLGCREAWVLTDRENDAAMRLYASLDGEASDQVMFSFSLNVRESS
jgi:ribosomal protein S18 acetylase RimI-like enzyme